MLTFEQGGFEPPSSTQLIKPLIDMAYHLTDHDIQALIDNELDSDQQKFVQELIRKNIYAQKRYEELLRQKKMIQLWWSHKNK